MELKSTLILSFAVYLLGCFVFYLQSGSESLLWFAIGGGLALVNVFFAAWAVRYGFKSLKRKALFLGLLLLKSFSFVLVVAAVIMFFKPLLLPFTLGLGLVIFSSVIVAFTKAGKIRM